MIDHITITSGTKSGVDEATKKYVVKKISRLDRFLPRHARESVSAEVILKEVNRAYGNKYEAEVIIKLPQKTLVAKDSTLNILAAIDIVEAKLVSQLHRYKTALKRRSKRGRILLRLRRGSGLRAEKKS